MNKTSIILFILFPMTLLGQMNVSHLNENQKSNLTLVSKYIVNLSSLTSLNFKNDRLMSADDTFNSYIFKYRTNGKPKMISIYNNIVDTSQYITFDENMNIINKSTYRKEPNSTSDIQISDIDYFKTGKVSKEVIYYNDKTVETYFAENGIKEVVYVYLENNIRIDSLFNENDGKIEEVMFLKNNKLDGKYNLYSQNGAINATATLRQNSIQEIVEFDKNGEIRNSTKVENGNGYWRHYDIDDKLCCECQVENGKLKKCKSISSESKIVSLMKKK